MRVQNYIGMFWFECMNLFFLFSKTDLKSRLAKLAARHPALTRVRQWLSFTNASQKFEVRLKNLVISVWFQTTSRLDRECLRRPKTSRLWQDIVNWKRRVM